MLILVKINEQELLEGVSYGRYYLNGPSRTTKTVETDKARNCGTQLGDHWNTIRDSSITEQNKAMQKSDESQERRMSTMLSLG